MINRQYKTSPEGGPMDQWSDFCFRFLITVDKELSLQLNCFEINIHQHKLFNIDIIGVTPVWSQIQLTHDFFRKSSSDSTLPGKPPLENSQGPGSKQAGKSPLKHFLTSPWCD